MDVEVGGLAEWQSVDQLSPSYLEEAGITQGEALPAAFGLSQRRGFQLQADEGRGRTQCSLCLLEDRKVSPRYGFRPFGSDRVHPVEHLGWRQFLRRPVNKGAGEKTCPASRLEVVARAIGYRSDTGSNRIVKRILILRVG